MSRISKLLRSLAGCFLVAWLGSIITTPSISGWYSSLERPFFTPPNWLFGPVWTVLYILMAMAFYLVWTQKAKPGLTEKAIQIFILQLIFNLAWSMAFFGGKSPIAGLIVIIGLWLSILSTILTFHKISAKAAYLLIPYFLWVSFASLLNFAIVILN